MRKLKTTDNYFEYILDLTPEKLAIITAERKWTDGYDFCSLLLFHCAAELHKIDPFITFGLLRSTQLYFVTNDRAFHTFFYNFCQLQASVIGRLQVINVRTGSSFGLGTMFIVRYVDNRHDILGTTIAGAMINKDFDKQDSLYDAVKIRVENKFAGSCRAEKLISLVHLT